MDQVSTVIVQHSIPPRPATALAFADHKSNKAATKSLGLMLLGAPSLTELAARIKGRLLYQVIPRKTSREQQLQIR